MGAKRRKLSTPGSERLGADAPEIPERWSAARKTELVLRLLRGDALDARAPRTQAKNGVGVWPLILSRGWRSASAPWVGISRVRHRSWPTTNQARTA